MFAMKCFLHKYHLAADLRTLAIKTCIAKNNNNNNNFLVLFPIVSPLQFLWSSIT